MKKQLLLYVVYGPDDKEYFDHLKKHLTFSRRNNEIAVWGRSEILPGQETDKEIHSKLAEADIALLLITAHSIDSEISYQEMMLTLSTFQRQQKPVYHLIMQYVAYQQSFFDYVSPLLPDNLLPVMGHNNVEKPLSEAATKLGSIAEDIKAGNASFDTTSRLVPSIITLEEAEPEPMLLGFALDISSSVIDNLRSQNMGKEKGKNAITLLMETARSIHTMLGSDPELLSRLQTSLFLYAFGLKLRPIIDVYTCMNVAQNLITSEIIQTYANQRSKSVIAEVFNSFSASLPVDHRRSLRKVGKNLVENWVAQSIVEDYAEQIIKKTEQSSFITPTLADFWEQIEEHSGMRLYHAAYFVGGKKPSLAAVFSPIIQRFQQELNKTENKPKAFFFFLSDGEFSSYQFSPFKQQLEELGVTIISCYLSKRDFTHNYRILHGVAKDHWSEEAQELWNMASIVDMPEKWLANFTKRGWHIEKEARFFLQINHSTMLTDLLAALLQERQKSL